MLAHRFANVFRGATARAALVSCAAFVLVSGGGERTARAASVCYQHPLPPNISDGYGQQPDRFHRGTDYVAGTGTPIGAVANGTVVHKTWDSCQGNVVVLAHNDGMFSSYSHMLNESPLAQGQQVGAGGLVGHVSMTGTCVTGPHLHLTISDHANGYNSGTNVDPFAYIEGHKTCTSGYKSSWVAQSYPASGELTVSPGQVVPVWIDMKNEGTLPWKVGEVFLGTAAPRESECVFAGPDWPTKKRASSIDAETAPGKVGRFSFSVKAPQTPGSYTQHLSALREGVTWFGDDGGPEDTHFWLRLKVELAKGGGGSGSGGSKAGSGGSGGASGKGGAAGAAGKSGGAGEPSKGGASSNGGQSGASNAGGASGASGNGGRGGASGKNGAAGQSGVSGQSGAASASGSAGASGGSTKRTRPDDEGPEWVEAPDEGEGSCSVSPQPGNRGTTVAAALGLLVAAAGHRARRRQKRAS